MLLKLRQLERPNETGQIAEWHLVLEKHEEFGCSECGDTIKAGSEIKYVELAAKIRIYCQDCNHIDPIGSIRSKLCKVRRTK